MNKNDKVARICQGKEIRIFGARDDSAASVTFVQSFRNCGRKYCTPCKKSDNHPHGPYWNLNYVDEHGRSKSMYIGRKLPDNLAHHKVLFAEVQRYLKLQETHKDTVSRLNSEKDQLRKELERLYEDLRIAQKNTRRGATSTAEKTFKELVNKYHPDRNKGKSFTAEDVMKDINRLYQKLSGK